MISTKTISVVMCTYNGEKYLREQLDSIVQQSYPIHELFIQDDQSTDQTVNIVHEYQSHYPYIRLHINDKNLGFNKNFRTAILKAEGDFISIADQDDVWHPDKLKEMVACIKDKVLCFSFSSTSNTQTTEQIEQALNNNTTLERLLFSNCIPGHSMLVRRSFVHSIATWHDDILYDWWLAVNAHLYGNGSNRCNRILTYHRVHEESAMNRYHQQNEQKENPYMPYLKGYSRYRELTKKAAWQNFYRPIYEMTCRKEQLQTPHRMVGVMLKKGFFPFLRLCFYCASHKKEITVKKKTNMLRAFFYPCFYATNNKCFDSRTFHEE